MPITTNLTFERYGWKIIVLVHVFKFLKLMWFFTFFTGPRIDTTRMTEQELKKWLPNKGLSEKDLRLLVGG